MRHVACSMDRTSGGTTSPWHYTITWGIYCLQQWALQRSCRPGCPPSLPQGDILTLSFIHPQPQSWTLQESGALRSLRQGQNSPSPLWKTLVKLILNYRAQWYKFSGTVPLTRYLILNIHLCDLWKNSQIYGNTSDSFAKTIHSGLSCSSFPLSVYDIWVNIITRYIC